MLRLRQKVEQLWMDFNKSFTPAWHAPSLAEDHAAQQDVPLSAERDEALEKECRAHLTRLGMKNMLKRVQVRWNPRLRSTAGYASFPAWRIELNPLLKNFDGQVRRTMLHELAHLVAFQRKGHTRIKPHGREWRKACADLGIPDETAHHKLALPRSPKERPLTYMCVACGAVVRRVRKFRGPSACLACCKLHSGGEYDARFIFQLVSDGRVRRRSPQFD
jgi:predicted SprT family Zn-dependent metalloprotease